MVKFQIVGGSLAISNGDTRLSVTPTKDIAIESIALYSATPRAILYNSSVGNNEVLFDQVLSQIVDENDDELNWDPTAIWNMKVKGKGL